MQTFTALFSAFDGGGVPEWVHLVPDGTFKGVDGRGPYTLADPAGVIATSMAAGKLAIDENHAIDLSGPQGQPSPARGWIVAMEARADGIWGRVEWTESGRALMADAAYRGISPVFVHDKSGRIQRVLRAALTNTPNLGELAKLNHQQEPSMDLIKMRSLLGLAADADEAAILSAIERQSAAATQATALQAQLATLQAAAIKPETVVALQAQVAELQAGAARTKAVAAVDAAIAAGKQIVALRDHYVARHMADPASVEAELAKLPSIHAGGLTAAQAAARHDAEDGDGLTQDEMSICKKMGIEPKKYAAQFKKKAA